MTNETLAGVVRPADTLTQHPGYQFWLPCNGIAADAEVVADESFNAHNFDEDTGSTDLGANPGFMTTAAATNGGIETAAANFVWDFSAGDSFLISFWIICTGGQVTNYGVLGNQIGAFNGGVYVSVGAAQKLNWTFVDGAKHAAGTNFGSVVADATLHHVVGALDSTTGLLYQYLDGVFDASFDTELANSTLTDNHEFAVGHYVTLAGWGYQFRDVHAIVFSGVGLPSSISSAVKLLYSRPFYPLTAEDLA